jgi:outer membrane biosynthesis protein TonB
MTFVPFEQYIINLIEQLRVEVAMARTELQVVINDLKSALESNTSATSSMVMYVTELLAKIEEAKDDPTELMDAVNKFRANTAMLVAATVVNTPADEPVPEPTPVEPAPEPAPEPMPEPAPEVPAEEPAADPAPENQG